MDGEYSCFKLFIPVPSEALIFADAGSGQILLTSTTSEPTTKPAVLAYSPRPVAVTFDPVKREVFWSDVKERLVYRMKLGDGGDGVLGRKEVMLNASHGIGFVEGSMDNKCL